MSDRHSPPPSATSRSRPGTPALVYGIDDRLPLREAVPLGLQHVVAMLLGNITPPLLIAGALALSVGETGLLLQVALLLAGVATLVQACPIGPVGGRIGLLLSLALPGRTDAAGEAG